MSTEADQRDFGAFMAFLQRMGCSITLPTGDTLPPGFAPQPVFAPTPASVPTPTLASAPALGPTLAPALTPVLAPTPAPRVTPAIVPAINPTPAEAASLAQTIPPRTLVARLVPSPPSTNTSPPLPSSTKIRSSSLVDRRPTFTFTYRAKPKGSPGRGNTGGRFGYNLQAAVGLTAPAYAWIHGQIKIICQRYLDMRQTVKFQDKRYLMHTHKKILEQFPEFNGYDDPLWPVKDFVHIILRASNNTFKRTLARTELAQAELEAKQAAERAAEEMAAEAAAAAEDEDFDYMVNEMSRASIAYDDLPSESMNGDLNAAGAPAPHPPSAPFRAPPPALAPTSTMTVTGWPNTAQFPVTNVLTAAPTPLSTSTPVAPAPPTIHGPVHAPGPRPRGRPRKNPVLSPGFSDPGAAAPAPASTATPVFISTPVSAPTPTPTAPASTVAAHATPVANATPAVPSLVPAPVRVRPTPRAGHAPIAHQDPAPNVVNNDTTRAPSSNSLVGTLSPSSHNGQSPSPPLSVTQATACASSSTVRKQLGLEAGYSSDLSEASVTSSNLPVESEDEQISQPVVNSRGTGKGKKLTPKTNAVKEPAINRKVLPSIPAGPTKKSTRISKPVTKYH